MPESLFAPPATGTLPSFEVIESLASEFRTTLTATAIRYVQLYGQSCAVVCSTNGKVAWSWPSPEFHYWIKRGWELRAHSYAIDFFYKGCGLKHTLGEVFAWAIARKAFDAVLGQELHEVIQEAKRMANEIEKSSDLWDLEHYLTQRRNEIDRKYDSRGSRLTDVLGRLLYENRLREGDLRGLREDKLETVRSFAKFLAENAA